MVVLALIASCTGNGPAQGAAGGPTVSGYEGSLWAGRHAQVRSWRAANAAELVVLPTYGSWLNWIEAEFAALRYFALNGTDHRSHAEQNAVIAAYGR